MELTELKKRAADCETILQNDLLAEFDKQSVAGKTQVTYLTSSLLKKCKKGRVWKSQAFLITLKNIKYGFDELQSRSVSGRDGIFLIDRHFQPRNSMQKKIFDQFIDKDTSDFREIVTLLELESTELKAVRVVSHHLRLLGILEQRKDKNILVLVDYDDEK